MEKIKEIRSDLAIELCGAGEKKEDEERGIFLSRERLGPLFLEKVRITTPQGEAFTGKPMGEYLTISCGKLWLDHRERLKEKLFCFRDLLRSLFPSPMEGGVLVAGLGNESITPDAIGPVAVKNLLVTRHVRREKPTLFQEMGLGELSAIAPGVLGQTGIESAEVICSIVSRVKPSLLIVIDALASRELSRLVNTIQISNSGIRPGSGIGNERPALTPKELGIPVLSIGVPTVVDAASLAADAIATFSREKVDGDRIRRVWSQNGLNFFVTPKETDQVIQVLGAFIAHGINLARNPSLSYEDMLSLAGG